MQERYRCEVVDGDVPLLASALEDLGTQIAVLESFHDDVERTWAVCGWEPLLLQELRVAHLDVRHGNFLDSVCHSQGAKEFLQQLDILVCGLDSLRLLVLVDDIEEVAIKLRVDRLVDEEGDVSNARAEGWVVGDLDCTLERSQVGDVDGSVGEEVVREDVESLVVRSLAGETQGLDVLQLELFRDFLEELWCEAEERGVRVFLLRRNFSEETCEEASEMHDCGHASRFVVIRRGGTLRLLGGSTKACRNCGGGRGR